MDKLAVCNKDSTERFIWNYLAYTAIPTISYKESFISYQYSSTFWQYGPVRWGPASDNRSQNTVFLQSVFSHNWSTATFQYPPWTELSCLVRTSEFVDFEKESQWPLWTTPTIWQLGLNGLTCMELDIMPLQNFIVDLGWRMIRSLGNSFGRLQRLTNWSLNYYTTWTGTDRFRWTTADGCFLTSKGTYERDRYGAFSVDIGGRLIWTLRKSIDGTFLKIVRWDHGGKFVVDV